MSVISSATPTWTGATPVDLDSFVIKAVCFDPTTTSPPIGAYLLATDGTDSAIWYTPDAFSKPAQWVIGDTFDGVYTDIRSAGTPGSVIVYSPGDGTLTTTIYDFRGGNQHGFAPVFSSPTTYAVWNGAGWDAGYLGTEPSGIYFQNQIFLNVSAYNAYSMTVLYDCSAQVTLDDALGSTTVVGPAGTNQTVTILQNGSLSLIRPIMTTYPVTDPGTNINVKQVTIVGVSGNSSVCLSTDYGATVGGAVTVGAPGAVGAVDLVRLGGASIASADGQVVLATTLGGSYSPAPGGVLSSGQPVSLVIPVRRWDNGATQYSAVDPDYLLMASALDSGESCWKVDGSSGTRTDITPVAGAVGVGPNLATVFQTASTCYILLCVNNAGTYEVYRSDDAGATFTLSKTVTNPKFLRFGRNRSTLYLLDGSSLFVSLDKGLTWAARTLPSTNTAQYLDMYT